MTRLVHIGGTDRPDEQASAQGVYGLLCTRGCRRSSLEGYLGADAALVRWYCDPATWPVDHAVARQEGREYFVWCYGTTNIAQWSTNVAGATGVRQGERGPLWHAGFADAADILFGHLKELWDADGPPNYLAVYGHSLGGGAGQLLCYRVRAAYPSCQVELCTFGQPAASGPGVPADQLPARHYRFASTGDPVPYLPGAFGGLVWVWASAVQGWVADYPAYTQVGTAVTLPTFAGAFGLLPTLVSTDPIGAHLMPNYWARLNAWQRAFGTSAAAAATLALARDLAFGLDVHQFASAVPGTVETPTGELAAVPTAPPFNLGTEVRSMAWPNDALIGGAPLRITLFFDWSPDLGWSETYDAYTRTAPPDTTLWRDWLRTLVRLRRAMLSKFCTLRRARISFPGQKTRAMLMSDRQLPGVFGIGTDSSGSTGPSINQAVNMRLFSLDGTRTSARQLRGFKSAVLANLGDDPVNTNPWVGGSNGNFAEFANFLIRGGTLSGVPVNIVSAIGSTDRAAAKVTPLTIFVDAQGYLTVTVPNGSLLFPGTPPRVPGPTDIVQVFHTRQACIKGLSGRFGVISFTAGPDVSTLTLATRPCCSPAELVAARIQVQPVVALYYGANDWSAVAQTTRNMGRPFAQRRGRRRRCCK